MISAPRNFETQDLVDEIIDLCEHLNHDVAHIERLTTLPSKHLKRGSFRVTLADGRKFKARCFPDTEQAYLVGELSRYTPVTNFPKVLTHHENILWIEWVDGLALDNKSCFDRWCYTAGVIQRKLHDQQLPEKYFDPVYSSVEYWQDRLERRIKYLLENELLTYSEKTKLMQNSFVERVVELPQGLIHGDYCVENMIIRLDRQLAVVDIENYAVTALEYDLARTAYRWKMNTGQRQQYLAGYGPCPVIDRFMDYLNFWFLLVLCESVYFRSVGRLDSLEEPLKTLKKALEHENDVSFGKYLAIQ